MATYYRWRKSEAKLVAGSLTPASGGAYSNGQGNKIYYSSTLPPIVGNNYSFSLSTNIINNLDVVGTGWSQYYFAFQQVTNIIYTNADTITYDGSALRITGTNLKYRMLDWGPGALVSYVYSTSPSAYPNGAQIDGYYYDQRTTVTSPTAPTGLTYPNPITTPTVTVSWNAATSNVPDYPVDHYLLAYGFDSGQWKGEIEVPAGTTSYQFSIPAGTTQLKFSVFAYDTNNQRTQSAVGPLVPVYLAPTLTVPQMVMQGQQATISWTAIDGADSYTLQRKSSEDEDWTQIYSGADLNYTETVGTWTSLQYRVQAVFSDTPGGWATSGEIQIVSASALVISGSDSDLGTLTNDVSYAVSSSGSTELTVTEIINGTETRTFTATNGATNKISVIDLPTGYGTIKITASTNPGSGVVSVERNWTYSKTAQTFPNSSSVATLTQEGKTIWAKTIAEAVRTPSIWGGNLGLALQKLMGAMLYNREQKAKYPFEISIDLSTAQEGDIVKLPENGRAVEFLVSKLNYEQELNGAGRTLLIRKDKWPSSKNWGSNGTYNTYSGCNVDTWMNGDYKGLFPEEIQTAMGTTKFYYTAGNGDNAVTTLERSVFVPSLTELGVSDTYANAEGSLLPTSETILQSGNGTMTRTPHLSNNQAYFGVLIQNSDPIAWSSSVSSYFTTAPMFTLQNTFTYTYWVDSSGNASTEQEYIEAGTLTDISGGAIPMVQIETGSYVGTGTHGQSNPTKLTFSFVPKIVFINSNVSGTEFGIFVYGCQSVATSWTMGSHSREPSVATVSWSGNQLSFYDTVVDYNGFVTITSAEEEYEEGFFRTVYTVEPNLEAWEKWKASQPDPEEIPPTKEEQLRADVDYLALMTGVDLV